MKTILSLSLLLFLCSFGLAAEYLAALSFSAGTIKQGDVCLITCQVKKPADIQIQILDAQGKTVRTMLAFQPKVRGEYPWNGKDDAGKLVPAGEYTVRVQARLKPQLDKTFGKEGALDEFTSPFDVAVDKAGNVFVADRGDKIIYKLTADGKPAEDFANKGKILLPDGHRAPQTVKVDGAGYLYITGPFHNVAKYDKKGNLIGTIGGWFLDEGGQHSPENTVNPMGFALGDDKIYIQRGGADGVVVFNPSFTGKDGFIFKSSGNPFVYSANLPGLGYSGPGLDATKDGTLYGVGLWNQLTKAVDTGEEIEAKYNSTLGPDGAAMRNPTGVAIAPDGTVWVADWGNGRLIRFFDTGGALVPVFSFGEQAENALEQGGFVNPHGIAISADGKYLYIAEDGEPAYNYETKAAQAFSGGHRVSRWIIDAFADKVEQKVTVTP
ncbi:MAG: FlgD immunoglobulin-like domain containing protein [Armatimonadota bacterium]